MQVNNFENRVKPQDSGVGLSKAVAQQTSNAVTFHVGDDHFTAFGRKADQVKALNTEHTAIFVEKGEAAATEFDKTVRRPSLQSLALEAQQ